MKLQIQDRTVAFFRAAALGLSVLVGGISQQATALEAGAAAKLTGLKILTPAGDTVEISTKDEPLKSVSLEVEIEADQQGVGYFELTFRSPDGTRSVTYGGHGDWTPTKSDPLKPRDETKQTFVLTSRNLQLFSGALSFYQPLEVVGDWTLDSVYLAGNNSKSTFLSAGEGNLPAGLTASFRVTEWFAEQPLFTKALVGGTLVLTPKISAAAVVSPVYQWFRNGTAIPGATNVQYSKANVTASDGGLYYLQVTSGGTKVRSDAVPVSIRSKDVDKARSAINLQNAAEAKQKAVAALGASPDGGEERFVLALSELLGVFSDPLTSALLADMGVSVTPKFPFSNFNWTGTFTATANSAKFSSWLLSVFLPAVERADAALEKITDPRFVTYVSGEDFGKWSPSGGALDANLLVDYGDIQLLRGGMNALSAFFRLWTSMDTSVRMDSLQALLPQGKLSVESILKEYPNLLAASVGGKANQTLSVDAMVRAAAAYKKFSDFVFNPLGRYIDGDLNLFNVNRQFGGDGIIGFENDPYFLDLASNISVSAAEGTRSFIADSKTRQGVTSRYPVNLKALKERSPGIRAADASQSVVPKFTKNLANGLISNGSFNGILPDLKGASLLARMAANEPAITEALGTREDQSAPSLDLTEYPANGSKVLLGSVPISVRFSGTVQDESELSGVFLKLNRRGGTDLHLATLTEGQSKQVGGKTIRSWNWNVQVPFYISSPCSYSLYAEDQFNQKSELKKGSFGVVRAVSVSVSPVDVEMGTVSVVPRIPSNGLVEVGTRLRISAVAKPGSVFSKLQIKVADVPLADSVRPVRDFLVTDRTEITPVFIPNLFPARAGQWTGVFNQEGGGGLVNLAVTKTGTFTLRVVQGLKTFSYAGLMDPSGRTSIEVPSSFYAVGPGESAATFSIDLSNGVRFTTDRPGVPASPSDLAKADPAKVKDLTSKRFNAGLLGSNDAAVGYFGFDVTPAGAVLATGMVNLRGEGAYPQKTVRYSFSTPLVIFASAPSNLTRPGMKIYAVPSPSNISLSGSALIDGGTLEGNVGTSTVPVASTTVPSASPDAYATENVELLGAAYTAPSNQGWVLPASSVLTRFKAVAVARSAGQLYENETRETMGTLNFASGKSPTFTAATGSFVVNKTTFGLASATGAFSGSLVTQTNGVRTARPYFGVVLRAAGSAVTEPLALGMSVDGVLISILPVEP
jgi:hypothetical protein